MRSSHVILLLPLLLTVDAKAQSGLPLTQFFQEDIQARGWKTTNSSLAFGRYIQATAFTSYKGIAQRSPIFVLTVTSKKAGHPRWVGASHLKFDYSGRRLIVQATKTTKYDKGAAIETLVTVLTSYDFANIANSKLLYLTIMDNTIEIEGWQLAGMRALAQKFDPHIAAPKIGSPELLKRGTSGDAVLHWQIFLINQGFLKPPALGNFGERTHLATIKFQKRYKLVPNGVVTSQTMNKAVQLGYKR